MRAFAPRLIFSVAVAALTACYGVHINDPPSPDGVDALTVSPTTAMADGNSVVSLVLVDTNPLPSDLKVALTTSIGTFLGGSNNAITVALNDSGRAYAQLKAPASAGSAIITTTAAGVTRYFTISFTPAPTSRGALDIILSSRRAPADGATTVTITLPVDTSPRPSPFTVTLTATAGTFLGGTAAATITVPVNDSGIARAVLRAPTDSTAALVTATAGSVTRSTEVFFEPAPPSALQLTGDFTVKAGAVNSAAVTAQLLRSVGAPSPGATVRFSADTARGTGGTFGQFSVRTAVTGAASTVNTRFSTGETPYRGPVVVRAEATRGAAVVRDSVVIQVTPP